MQLASSAQRCVVRSQNPEPHSIPFMHASPTAFTAVHMFESWLQYTVAESAHWNVCAHDSPTAGYAMHLFVTPASQRKYGEQSEFTAHVAPGRPTSRHAPPVQCRPSSRQRPSGHACASVGNARHVVVGVPMQSSP
jgi:hypothetical protein